MRNIGIYKFDNGLYGNLIERLKSLDINLISLEDGQLESNIDLYIFDLDSPTDFEGLVFDKAFIIISSLNDAKFLKKSRQLGALDYIFKPFTDIELTAKRIQRVLENKDNAQKIKTSQIIQFDKLIDIELKRAHRGKYPVTLASVVLETAINKETVIRLIDKLKTILRDSDSCIPYTDKNIVIILPFTDNVGSVIVSRKVTDLINELGFKNYCLCAVYPEHGDTRVEMMENLGKSSDTREIYK